MDFSQYQQKALLTDQVNNQSEDNHNKHEIIVPLLGLAGEAGSLLTEYKKHLRDGDAHKLFKEGIAEELGDLLWYIANISSKFELNLNEIAEGNLQKCYDRWGQDKKENSTGYIFDRSFPESERLPRQFSVEITETKENDSIKMQAFINGKQIGNDLTDNSYSEDGYRFHDIFHFAYVAVLGWSPVFRSLFKCKRKSNSKIDEVEDGGRAVAIEEGISALVFSYAKDHDFLEGVTAIDYPFLKTIKGMTYHLEVSQCSLADWQKAIIMGFDVWREVNKNSGGKVIVDIDNSSIIYQKK
jgi:NTP pyrophosphatase (non-canonical NTP hydrolase)